MQRLGRLILGTLVQGVLFLVPIVLIAALAREAYGLLRRLFEPVARLLPADRVVGLLLEDLLAIAVLALVFLIAGLFVGTRPGRVLSNRLEQTVLYRLPGYLMVRGVVAGLDGLDAEARPEPVLVETDEGWGRYAVDGVRLSTSPDPGTDHPWLQIGPVDATADASSPALAGALEFAAALAEDLRPGARIRIEPGGELWAEVGGYQVRLGRPVEMREKALSLAALIREQPPPGSILTLIAPTNPAITPS